MPSKVRRRAGRLRRKAVQAAPAATSEVKSDADSTVGEEPVSSMCSSSVLAPGLVMRMVWFFRCLFQHDDQHCLQATIQARRRAKLRDDVEADFIFAVDEADFVEEQLTAQIHAANRATDIFMSNGLLTGLWFQELQSQRLLAARKAAVRDLDVVLKKQRDLQGRLNSWHQRAALAIARFRLLRALSELAGRGPSTLGDAPAAASVLVSILRRCEEELSAESPSSIQPSPKLSLAAEFEAASPLALVLPLLPLLHAGSHDCTHSANCSGEPVLLDSSNDAEAEEEALQILIGNLAEQNDRLRKAAGIEQQKGKCKDADDRCGCDWDDPQINEQTWEEVAALRRDLTATYERLAVFKAAELDEEIVDLRRRCEDAEAEHDRLQMAEMMHQRPDLLPPDGPRNLRPKQLGWRLLAVPPRHGLSPAPSRTRLASPQRCVSPAPSQAQSPKPSRHASLTPSQTRLPSSEHLTLGATEGTWAAFSRAPPASPASSVSPLLSTRELRPMGTNCMTGAAAPFLASSPLIKQQEEEVSAVHVQHIARLPSATGAIPLPQVRTDRDRAQFVALRRYKSAVGL